jgi:hypothetical protein
LPAPEPVVRFGTAPGHQTQKDWGEDRLDRQKIFDFVGVLGYSRWMYFEYVKPMLVNIAGMFGVINQTHQGLSEVDCRHLCPGSSTPSSR